MEEAKTMKCYKRLVYKQFIQVSGRCRVSSFWVIFWNISRTFVEYGDAILVYRFGAPTWPPEINKNIWSSLFHRISSHKIFILKYLDNAVKLHEHQGGYWRKKLPWTIFEEQFPVPRNTAAVKYVIASFPRYDNSNIVATLIITNFHLPPHKYNCGGNFSKSLFMAT